MPDGELDDEVLLRAYEPVIRFTRGEYFYPVSVERYVAQAALWSTPQEGGSQMVARPGTLDLPGLVASSAVTQGLGEALSGIATGVKPDRLTIPIKDRPPRLEGGSRLAAVGMLARMVDALSRVSLVFRGSVPGGSAARSFLLQQRELAPDEPTYYGRVVRDGHWIVCQYWFFYAFNNWRSAFGGVNEHEADWEQVTIYLDGAGEPGADGLPEPRWVVFSAHDETGDDLRRRWDDPDLSLVDGRHPVVFAGAGSHSGAYLAGDYLITVATPTLGGLVRVMRRLGRLVAPWPGSEVDGGLGIPYVDYARGDGRVIGAGGDAWHPVVINESTGWVRDYRGLWGHDTRDRLGGERGPAGPRYERDGTVRQSWADPVGWAGLAKVAPNADVEAALIGARLAELGDRLSQLESEVAPARVALERSAAGLAPASPEVRSLVPEEKRILGMNMEITLLRDERARMQASLGQAPPVADPQAHLRHRRTPLESVRGLRSRLLAGWAVISTPVLLYGISAIIMPTIAVSASITALVWVVLLLSVEGLVRGRFLSVIGRLFLAAALLVGLYYLVVDWRIVLAWTFAGAAAVLLAVNLRDALKR